MGDGSDMKRPAIFLDRDGTVSEEVGYINHIDRFRIIPGAPEAIRQINQSGYLAVLVTNQAGVARGLFPESLVEAVHRRLVRELKDAGAHLDGIYFCPHHPLEGPAPYRKACDCRKPAPGMIHRAVRDLNIDLSRAFMVGDNLSDLKLADNAGIPGVLVLTGYGKGVRERLRRDESVKPARIAADLREAVTWILNRKG
jgi:D-glycero-D-manno-heptose 1,7-bisphosphate phosphatase